MSVLNQILKELDEIYLVEKVTKVHDEARIQYPLKSITVSHDTEFDDVIANYYNHHFTRCVSGGGKLSRAEAAGRAKEIINQEYRQHGKDKLHAYADGKNGTNGGMRSILDIIMEYLKAEAVNHHIRDVLDRYIAPTSFKEQVAIIKELIGKIGNSPYLDANNPERYAKNYEELVRGLADSIKAQSAKLRRL